MSRSLASARPPARIRHGGRIPRWCSTTCAILGASIVVGCSAPGGSEERIATNRAPIAYGTADTAHTAVVSVLAPVDSSTFEECTGSLVKVASGFGYVLTAAHCCNTYVPTIVVASNSYARGEGFLSGGTPAPPVYAVAAGSVFYDAQYAGADHDFCMLKFSGASSSMPTLALPTSSSDGLAIGSTIEHVGFGITETSTSTTSRRTGTDTVDLELTPLIFEFSQGGPNKIPGTCDGDSGGPSLLPAGVAQAQQTVVGVQSFGSATSCAQDTLGGASRVSSEIGAGRFITSYLAGSPTGIQAGGSVSAPPVPAGGPWTLASFAAALVAVSTRRARPSSVLRAT